MAEDLCPLGRLCVGYFERRVTLLNKVDQPHDYHLALNQGSV